MTKFGMWAAVLLGAATIAGAAEASTIGFDGDKPKKDDAYLEATYAFFDARLVNGECLSGGCLALNNNETTTMARVDEALFDIDAITFQLLGEGGSHRRAASTNNTLTLTADTGATISFSTANFSAGAYHTVALDPAFFSSIRSIAFSASNGGNVRIDGLSAGVPAAASATVGVSAVPLPASAWLLAASLAGLGFLRRRKAA